MIVLAFPGMAPAAKARPRVTGNGTYMPLAYRDWKREFAMLARIQWRQTVAGRLRAWITFKTHTGNMRPDLDNAAGACLDALQDAGIIENDKQIKHLTIGIEKAPKSDCGIFLQIEMLPDVPSAARKATKPRRSTQQSSHPINTSN